MGIGGAETHILTLARALQRRGHYVHIVSAGGAYIPALISSKIMHTVLPLDRKDVISVVKSAREIKKLAVEGHFDVVHAHGRIPAFICGMLSKQQGFPPFAVTAHGFYDPAPPRRAFTLWGRRTIAVSEDVKAFLVENYKLDPASIDVIVNGVDTVVPEHQPSKRLRIVTASRLDGDTSLCSLLLCELILRLRRDFPELDPTLTVVGGGEKLPDVREAARRANALSPGAVNVAGSVLDMPSILARADIFIGSSRAALEAMASSVPVILCSDMGCDGVLDETNLRRAEETNFTCRGGAQTDMEILRLSIERLISATPRERALYGAFGRTYVTRRASADLFAEKTLAFWRDLIAGDRGGIMLCGYFGAGNAGDDATLDAVLSSLPKMPKGVLPTVPTVNPGRLPEGVVPIGRYNFLKIRKELSRTRLFLLCGGTLLQNSTSNRSLGYYYYLADLAVRRGARVMLYSGGIGPVIGEKAVDETIYTIENCDAVTLREPYSLDLLKKIGCSVDGIGVSADAALGTKPMPLPRAVTNMLPDDREIFAVSLRPLRGLARSEDARDPEEIYTMICNAVRVIADRRKAVPIFVPFAPEDVRLCEKLCKRTKRGIVLPLISAGQIVTLFSNCSAVIGMRLHSAVFASVAGIPALTLAYDPKVASFARYAYHPDPLDSNSPDINMRAIVNAASDLYDDYDEIILRVRSRAAELVRCLASDAELAAHIYKADI